MSSNEEEYMMEYGEGEMELEENVSAEELLIDCVRARPVLWDSRLPLSERSKTARDHMWLEIYKEFGEQEEYSLRYLLKRWRNLRDTYVRVKGEQDAYVPTGSAAKKRKKVWQYFDVMSFLNETLAPRPTTSNLKITPKSCSPLVGEGSTTEIEAGTQPEPDSCQVNKTPKGNKRRIDTESAIIDALNKVNANSAMPPQPPAPNKKINEICIRISDLIEKIPLRERTQLEIELLQTAFSKAGPYL